jgi:hypothetical protein
LQIDYQQNQILTKIHVKALGVEHSHQLITKKKLNTACFAIINVKPYMTEPTLTL